MALPRAQDRLVCRQMFKTRPSHYVVRQFLAHVRDTGCPETFDRISTTHPPNDPDVVAIASRFDVPRAKRPFGDMAPCPICNPYGSQYLHGCLIWCPSVGAIYAIGRECSDAVFGKGVLDNAISIYEREERERKYEDLLVELLPRLQELGQWGLNHLDLARRCDSLKGGLGGRPRLRRLLASAAVDGMTIRTSEAPSAKARGVFDSIRVISELRGKSLMTGKPGLVRKLNIALQRLQAVDAGTDEYDVIDRILMMTTADKGRAVKFTQQVIKDLEDVRAAIVDVLSFFEPEHLDLLRIWGNHPQGAHGLSVQFTDQWFRIGLGSEYWTARFDGLTPPALLPTFPEGDAAAGH